MRKSLCRDTRPEALCIADSLLWFSDSSFKYYIPPPPCIPQTSNPCTAHNPFPIICS